MLIRLSRSSATTSRARRLDCTSAYSLSSFSGFTQKPYGVVALARPTEALRYTGLRTLSTTARLRSDNINMADAFREMEANGVPKKGEPTAAAAPEQEQQKELPKLSAAEFRVYNRMAEHMDMFHNNFRQTWNLLHTACTTGKKPAGMTLRSFLQTGDDFAHHLTIHHTIEERHIFPVLAKKMPAFRKELELLTQHKQIHAGLEQFEAYIAACRAGERELRFGELGEVMDTFGAVLWEHLDAEVHELRAENMRRFWTAEEMRRLPM
ncbi:hypothetical protein Q7P37_007192 [Cladosporium fusiforme]